MRRPAAALRQLVTTLGAPGLMIGVFSLVSCVFGLIVLAQEARQPRRHVRSAVHGLLAEWVRAPDYLGLTLVDYADRWRAARPSDRPARRDDLERALERLGQELERQNARFPFVHVVAMTLLTAGGEPLAHWRSAALAEGADQDLGDAFPLLAAGPDRSPATLRVNLRPAAAFEETQRGLESSYRRLLLALVGLSAFSLLCLAYMILHAQALSERVAREAAQEATLDLADRTCHELGNGVFVLANERRNLAEHLDLVERFVAEAPAAAEAAARRAGLELEQAERQRAALRREYAARGIDPDVELRGSAAVARQVCRQIDVCADYLGLAVHELDTFLKRSTLPVERERIDVNACLNEASALLRPRLEAADARIARAADGPVEAIGDRRLLIHALVNLIKNAVEAASGGNPAVTLSASREGGLVRIDVADEGHGLPDGAWDAVFDDGYSTKGPGRGRGLAIVRESIALQQGEIEAFPRPGGGAIFRITLPAADVPAAP